MKNGWSAERKARQSVLIKTWRPWEHSTGPRSEAGKAAASQNSQKLSFESQNVEAIKLDIENLLRQVVELHHALKDG